MSKVFDGLDYPADQRPQASLGLLAIQIRDLYGVPGPTALAAAVLLDQGRAGPALMLLDQVIAEHQRMAEADAERKRARRGVA